jgi:hypothetical protein
VEVLDFSFAIREQLLPFIVGVAIREEFGFRRLQSRLFPKPRG